MSMLSNREIQLSGCKVMSDVKLSNLFTSARMAGSGWQPTGCHLLRLSTSHYKKVAC